MRSVRMDKWLWAVRLYKSRTLAAKACAAGKVRIGGHPVKPSRPVQVGEVLHAVVASEITRTVRVRAPLERRVAASVVGEYIEDLTPPSEYAKPRDPQYRPVLLRPKGSGRPTKKERRALSGWVEHTEGSD